MFTEGSDVRRWGEVAVLVSVGVLCDTMLLFTNTNISPLVFIPSMPLKV